MLSTLELGYGVKHIPKQNIHKKISRANLLQCMYGISIDFIILVILFNIDMI